MTTIQTVTESIRYGMIEVQDFARITEAMDQRRRAIVADAHNAVSDSRSNFTASLVISVACRIIAQDVDINGGRMAVRDLRPMVELYGRMLSDRHTASDEAWEAVISAAMSVSDDRLTYDPKNREVIAESFA